MKNNNIEYDDIFDELIIIFGERLDNPQVHILDNNVVVEFDDNDDISAIILPNFSRMLGREIDSSESFSLVKADIDNDSITMTLSWFGPDINITLSI